jgi:hypothetical protein
VPLHPRRKHFTLAGDVKAERIQATIKLGVDREDIGADLREFLRNFAKTI